MGFGDWIKDVFSKQEEQETYDMAPCTRCSYEYPIDVMQSEGSLMFCNECLEKKKVEDVELERKRKMMSRTAVLHFKCGDCSFKFKRAEDFRLSICPNCGGGNFFAEGRSYK